MEVIKHAAVKSKTGMIILGKCHADCFDLARNTGIKMSKNPKDQGFITSKDRFVSRRLAAIIAKRAGQLESPRKSGRKVTYLFSEDIWYQTDKYIYTHIHGYVEMKKDT